MTPQQKFDELAALLEPALKKAFLDAIADIRDNVVLKTVVAKLSSGDINGAITSMNIEPEAFVRLETAIREAFNSGGISFVETLPPIRDPDGARVRFFFSPRNPRAEAWIQDHSSQLVTRTTDEIKTAIRQSFAEGLSFGQNPTKTAIDVIGRVSRATGRREGGVIGLTAPQERFSSNARRELASGDREQLRAYLTRGRRDKSFDRVVTKAIKEGKPIPPKVIDTIIGRYSDRLLQLRGDTIGLNETMTAMAKSREEAVRQQIEAGKFGDDAVRKVWKHTPQEHPRKHHAAMNNKSVRLNEKFKLGNGVWLDGPHSDDAPASERLHCKCHIQYKVDYFAGVVAKYKARAA